MLGNVNVGCKPPQLRDASMYDRQTAAMEDAIERVERLTEELSERLVHCCGPRQQPITTAGQEGLPQMAPIAEQQAKRAARLRCAGERLAELIATLEI